MAHDLLPRSVQHSRLAFDDRDEPIGLIADLVERLPYPGCALLAVLGKHRELRV